MQAPSIYSTPMASPQAEWLNIAGDEKAESIVRLAPSSTKSVIEIGCGTGAVLAALDRKGFASHYWGCEPAAELCSQIPTDTISRLEEVVPQTFDSSFDGRVFDLAILSHVLEHLLSPSVLLSQALKRSKCVLVEVPIEANVAGLARQKVKHALGHVPSSDSSGHVQFFSRRTARMMVKYAGGRVVAERGYFPVAPYRAQANRSYQRAILLTSKIDRLARLYYEHFAMLVVPEEVESWDHLYARPA